MANVRAIDPAASNASVSAVMQPLPFGNYLLLELIAIGGMAEVYFARFAGEDDSPAMAVKRILPNISEKPEFISMFIDEAKITGLLDHPNIARVFDLGKTLGTYYIALEYIAGADLRQLWDRARSVGGLPLPLCCYILRQLCDGLDHAHRRKDSDGRPLLIVHRDVSPQNVLLSYEGDVKIIDFGIAKAADRLAQTQFGILKGKFAYMAPEQAKGDNIDHKVDIFALGVVLYELITGERAFRGETDFALLEKVRRVEVTPIRQLRPEVPRSLERVVMRALAKDPAQRYSWAASMSADLERCMQECNWTFTKSDLSRYIQQVFADEYKREQVRQTRAHRTDVENMLIRMQHIAKNGAPAGNADESLASISSDDLHGQEYTIDQTASPGIISVSGDGSIDDIDSMDNIPPAEKKKTRHGELAFSDETDIADDKYVAALQKELQKELANHPSIDGEGEENDVFVAEMTRSDVDAATPVQRPPRRAAEARAARMAATGRGQGNPGNPASYMPPRKPAIKEDLATLLADEPVYDAYKQPKISAESHNEQDLRTVGTSPHANPHTDEEQNHRVDLPSDGDGFDGFDAPKTVAFANSVEEEDSDEELATLDGGAFPGRMASPLGVRGVERVGERGVERVGERVGERRENPTVPNAAAKGKANFAPATTLPALSQVVIPAGSAINPAAASRKRDVAQDDSLYPEAKDDNAALGAPLGASKAESRAESRAEKADRAEKIEKAEKADVKNAWVSGGHKKPEQFGQFFDEDRAQQNDIRDIRPDERLGERPNDDRYSLGMPIATPQQPQANTSNQGQGSTLFNSSIHAAEHGIDRAATPQTQHQLQYNQISNPPTTWSSTLPMAGMRLPVSAWMLISLFIGTMIGSIAIAFLVNMTTIEPAASTVWQINTTPNDAVMILANGQLQSAKSFVTVPHQKNMRVRLERPGCDALEAVLWGHGQESDVLPAKLNCRDFDGLLSITAQNPASLAQKQILIDGIVLMSNTNVQKYPLPTGEHTIVVRAADGQESVNLVDVSDGPETVLRLP